MRMQFVNVKHYECQLSWVCYMQIENMDSPSNGELHQAHGDDAGECHVSEEQAWCLLG